MSAGKSEKPPRIKGLVKRCRSFKEDILSRLARNRSLGGDSQTNTTASGGIASPTGWNSDNENPMSGGIPGVEPHVSVSLRLKEAHLTLQFVESLIQKNCIDLLGGSSNVMLDLMGCLLNDVKKASASDSAAFQSAISQVKTALSDFLMSVDVLLLKEQCDDAQKELYFQKLQETMKTTREALIRLKNLIEAKENGHSSSSKTPLVSSAPKTAHTISASTDSKIFSNILTPSQANIGNRDEKPNWELNRDEKKPPLPPKLKQWSAKSFDTIDWSPKPSSPSNVPLSHKYSQNQLYNEVSRPLLHHNNNNSTSLLSQWLEQSSLSTTPAAPTSPFRSSTTSCSSNHLSQQQLHRSSLQQGLFNESASSSGGGNFQHYQVHQHHEHLQSSKLFELSSNSTHSQSQHWTDSSVYVGRSSTSSASAGTSTASKILQINGKKTRTFSDSCRLGSDDSLDKMLLVDESRSQSAATTHSQSLSLGSSLDNLLLVDAQSQQSGLSPNSTSNSGGGGGGGNRISVSSCNTNSGGGLAGLNTYDPDTDADVFVTELSKTGRSRENLSNANMLDQDDCSPPELPEKQNRIRHFLLGSEVSVYSPHQHLKSGGLTNSSLRCPSPYDNVQEGEDIDLTTWHGMSNLSPSSSSGLPRQSLSAICRDSFQQRQFMSYSESRNTLVGASMGFDSDEKPPLPPKKKHSLITAYVELMHNFDSHNHHHHHFHNHQNSFHYQHHQRENSSEFHHQLHHQHSHQAPLQTYPSANSGGSGPGVDTFSTSPTPTSLLVPSPSTVELKRTSFATSSSSYQHFTSSYSSNGSDTRLISPADENICISLDNRLNVPLKHAMVSPSSSSEGKSGLGLVVSKPPALPPKKTRAFLKSSLSEQGEHPLNLVAAQESSPPNTKSALSIPIGANLPVVGAPVLTPAHSFTGGDSVSLESPQRSLPFDEDDANLYILNPGPMLVMNDGSTTIGKPSCDGPEVKGGEPHVLIVYAASPILKDIKFREVFLLTYRNFVRPLDVVSLLWKRYQYFEKKTERISIVHSRATLDLFVDVINSLTPMDLDDDMVNKVRDCIYYLVNNGEILSALKARKGLIIKYGVRVKLLCPKPTPVSLAVTSEPQTLLQWNATSIAQQMTLLDSDLFRQLEPAELLLWAREQSEDFCPALNNFTEHFNKVSYWARSKVLTCITSRERNRTMKKLIEVMRKLREYNNFNSLLAVLAALDSAPIRRLGFSRRLTEALKPHAALTDSSGSFRTYRQALSESKPPCIPYIGLVLQDLTFVHIGNVDFLADGKVNWIKRWQQWVVLEPIRRFHSCQYGFIRNDSLLTFLNNFDESLNDDDLWQLSEQIKPRCKS